jgi:hypothetical protein
MSFDIVTLRVGEPVVAVDIPVYRDVLSAVSPYFRGAFEGSFREASEKLLPLVGVSEQTFRIFLQWAHMQAGPQSSGAAFPGLEVLVPNCSTEPAMDPTTATTDTNMAEDDGEGSDDDSASDSSTDSHSSAGSDPTSSDESMFPPAIDNDKYHPIVVVDEHTNQMYFNNEEWLRNFRSTIISYIRLYTFADKYNVHQLQDDILTAFIAQAHTWNWWPDPDKELIQFAYSNLPKSSKFLRLLVLSTAYLWLSTADGDTVAKLRAIQAMHPDFFFDVSVAQTERLRNSVSAKVGIPFRLADGIPNSCVLHEHLVHSKEQCRPRIRNNAHIFKALIDACVQDGLGMAEEKDEK